MTDNEITMEYFAGGWQHQARFSSLDDWHNALRFPELYVIENMHLPPLIPALANVSEFISSQ